jgi:TPR repeat protein
VHSYYGARYAASGEIPGAVSVSDMYWKNEPDMTQLRHAYSLRSTDPAQSLAELRALADRGSLASMVYLAEAYTKGLGTSVDLLQAEEWYKRAAQGGSVLASYHLGRSYLAKNDYLNAMKAFESGALAGYMPSTRQLGGLYLRGTGVERDLNKAREFFERASASGNVFAKRDLAYLLIRGHFGFLQILRGAGLFFTAIKDLTVVILTDPTRENLR